MLRSVFIYSLGVEYLGINGLFISIISLLSLADLGFGIALPFSLYKPLSENNTEKINVIMTFYAKVYKIVGIVVLVLGCSIVPFLNYFIKNIPDIKSIEFIYILFVINASVSYFFIYKKTLIIADQKGYVTATIELVFSLIQTIVQIIILYTTKNYILFLIVAIIFTICKNYYISLECKKRYSYLSKKVNKKLSKNELKEMNKNIIYLFIYKIAMAIEISIDNLIISKYLGLSMVGMYSNYLILIESIKGILMMVFGSLTASIGNLIAENNESKTYLVFKGMNFTSIWLYGISSMGLYLLGNSFVKVWLGETFVLDKQTILLLAISLYIFGTQSVLSHFRNSFGLFWEGRLRPLVMTILNIFFSLLFVKYLGLKGVILGTIVSRLLSVEIMDSYVIFKYGLKKELIYYYKYRVESTFVTSGILLMLKFLISFETLKSNSLLSLILKGFIIVILGSLFYWIFYFKREENVYILNLIKNNYKNKLGGRKNENL